MEETSHYLLGASSLFTSYKILPVHLWVFKQIFFNSTQHPIFPTLHSTTTHRYSPNTSYSSQQSLHIQLFNNYQQAISSIVLNCESQGKLEDDLNLLKNYHFWADFCFPEVLNLSTLRFHFLPKSLYMISFLSNLSSTSSLVLSHLSFFKYSPSTFDPTPLSLLSCLALAR